MSINDGERVHFAPEQQYREAVDRLFRQVTVMLRNLLPDADIQHVGSTAVPGSLTKGDLDVQVRVTAAEYAAAREKLLAVYAVNAGGFATDDAISFEESGTQPSLGVHLTVIGGTGDIQSQFRDLLLASAELRAQYDQLKRQFDGGSMDKYRDAKAEFVSRVLGGAQVEGE